jgi:sugar O-acyltransferase (sialic acid O-acetyltransferase NeuD family)
MARPLIILGTGGNAYDVLDIVDAINASAPAQQQQWEVTGFLDDARAAGSEFLGRPILGRLTEAGRFSRESFVNAIGSDASYAKRESIIASTGLADDRFATLVHPGAAVSSRSRLGRGTYVNYGASIAGNVNISAHVAVGPGCIVGHDGSIGAFSMLAPGAIVSGFVQIGRSVYVGAGAMLRQRLSVGDGALVGMGAVVLRDVTQGSVVVGNPARPMAKGADRR